MSERLSKMKSDALVRALGATDNNDVVVVRGELSALACTQIAEQFDADCGKSLSKYGWTAMELVKNG